MNSTTPLFLLCIVSQGSPPEYDKLLKNSLYCAGVTSDFGLVHMAEEELNCSWLEEEVREV